MKWIALIVLVCVAAGPATKPTTKPAKPDFPSPKSLIMAIPKSELPEVSRPWDDIANRKLGTWLKDHAVGKTLRLSFRLDRIFIEKGKPVTPAGWARVERDGRQFMCSVSVQFVEDAAAWLERQKAGALITVQGKIDKIDINGGAAPVFSLTVSDVDPRPQAIRGH